MGMGPVKPAAFIFMRKKRNVKKKMEKEKKGVGV